MTSREAFEAWKNVDSGGYYMSRNNTPGSDLGGYQDSHTQGQWLAWQAAIQHARDVAVKVCEEISDREHRAFKGRNPDAPKDKRGNPYVEGLSDGTDLATDAIKEALK